MDYNSELEKENKKLKAQLNSINHKKKEKWTKGFKFSKMLAGKFLGVKLKNAINAFFTELKENKNVSQDTVSELLASLFLRITRIGFFLLITSLLPTFLILLQVYYLKNQNRLITLQNERVKQQTFLQEADRRSFMTGILDDILNQVTSEALRNGGYVGTRNATRLVAISKNLKPYHYLENDKLIQKAVSPERGYLLLTLLQNGVKLDSEIDAHTGQTLEEEINFEYAELKNTTLSGIKTRNINLDFSDLRGSNFSKSELVGTKINSRFSTFKDANLENTIFDLCDLIRCDFSNSNLKNSSFANCTLKNVKFINAELENSDFSDSDLEKVNFKEANVFNAKFNNAIVSKDFMKLMEKQLPSKSFKYLERSYTVKTKKGKSTLIQKKVE